jgi:hypothetical protein
MRVHPDPPGGVVFSGKVTDKVGVVYARRPHANARR